MTDHVGDFNGDGRADLLQFKSGPEGAGGYVFLSDGRGFVGQDLWFGPVEVLDPSSQRSAIGDFNGDGRMDLAVNGRGVFLSRGDRFALEVQIAEGVKAVADIDGNGKADLVTFDRIRLAGGPVPDLLKSVVNTMGGTTEVAYDPSSKWGSHRLPYILQTVARVTLDDGRNQRATTGYGYAGGLWHWRERRFLGFRTARAELPCDANETLCPVRDYVFQQDVASAGRVKRVSFGQAAPGTATPTVLRSVDERYETETGAPPFRALNIGTTETTYFPQGSKVRETNRRFNPYGSLVEIAQDGDKAVDGEERRILRRFNPNPERFVVDKVARETVLGDGPEPLAETFYVYDDGADWEAPPTRGKLTRIRRWLDQPDGSVVRSFEYDNYGNRKAVVDEVGNRTEHDYDDQDHLFVTETRNPLFFPRGTEPGDPRQRTKARWDHVFGLVEATTDIDGLETAYAYDPLCRPQRVTQPGGDYKRWEYQNLGDPDAQATAVYGPPPSTGAGAGEIWTRTLFDGLGRTRSVQASGRGTIIVTHQGWTTRGLLAFRTEPLYQGDPWQTTAVRYDALDRPIETRRPDGARVGTAYGRSGSFFEAVTVTDELGRDTVSHRDAFGRTARVDRFWDGEPGGMIVSTHLAYDPFDRVTGVTGDRGNAWRYRYDSLGRRTESRDPALGTWTFSYDATGRRTGQVDGRGSRTRFTYDGLGRLLSRTTDAGTPPRRGRAHPVALLPGRGSGRLERGSLALRRGGAPALHPQPRGRHPLRRLREGDADHLRERHHHDLRALPRAGLARPGAPREGGGQRPAHSRLRARPRRQG